MQFTLHIRSEQQTSEHYQESSDHGGIDLNTAVNQPSSSKIRQSTTVSSQCERFY